MSRVYYLERRTSSCQSPPRAAWENADSVVAQLQSFVAGVLADGVVNEAEARSLHSLLESRSKAIADVGPAVSDLVARVEAFAADGVWAKEELVELQSLLEAFGSHRIAGNEPSKPLTHIFDEPQPSITYPGKEFVLSGQFAYGRKNLVIDVIESKGGVVHTNVRRSTDYLLVGSFVSEGWAHGSYGRKIEAAMEGRAAGHGIAIVSEGYWRTTI